MRLGDLKIIHILIVLALILWGYLFFDNQWNKRIAQLDRNQVVSAINDLNQRILKLEGKSPIQMPTPLPEPKK